MTSPQPLQRGAVTGRWPHRLRPPRVLTAVPPRTLLLPPCPAAAQDGGAAPSPARLVAGRRPPALLCPGQVSGAQGRLWWAWPGAGGTPAPASGGLAGAHREGGCAPLRVRGCMCLPVCVGVGMCSGGLHVLYVHIYVYIYMWWVCASVFICRRVCVCALCIRVDIGYRHRRIYVYRRVCIRVCLSPLHRRQLGPGWEAGARQVREPPEGPGLRPGAWQVTETLGPAGPGAPAHPPWRIWPLLHFLSALGGHRVPPWQQVMGRARPCPGTPVTLGAPGSRALGLGEGGFRGAGASSHHLRPWSRGSLACCWCEGTARPFPVCHVGCEPQLDEKVVLNKAQHRHKQLWK